MKALFFAADGVEDSELFYPLYRMKEEGVETTLAAPEKGAFSGKHGYSFEADCTFDDINASDFDVLVLPGGSAPEKVRLSDKAISVIKQMADSGKTIASICHGAQSLISADVLKGKDATCWQGIRDDIKAAGANYHDEQVVVDEKLITSRCPDDLPAFCKRLIEQTKMASGGQYQSAEGATQKSS
ncbi:MAG: type 1 glutamine amidotransferase domain-containing protein [Phycisphaerae bacterium]